MILQIFPTLINHYQELHQWEISNIIRDMKKVKRNQDYQQHILKNFIPLIEIETKIGIELVERK